MFSPVVLPFHLVMAILGLLAFAAYAYRRFLENTPNPWEGQAWATPAGGRHRLDDATEPYRDWAAITAERMNEQHCRRTGPVVIAGLGTWDDDTHELRMDMDALARDAERISLYPAS